MLTDPPESPMFRTSPPSSVPHAPSSITAASSAESLFVASIRVAPFHIGMEWTIHSMTFCRRCVVMCVHIPGLSDPEAS